MSSRIWRLLVVDDNEMNRNMLARRLERKGYATIAAAGAQNLAGLIEHDDIDLVLLDISMPEISGLEALQALRGKYSRIELPVIMVTARNQSEDIVTAFDLGANDYITKPIDFPVALARIRTHLSIKEAEEMVREREQGRIGQDLHDGLGQHLTGIAFLSKVLERKLAIRAQAEATDAAQIVGQVNEAISKTRALSRGLSPLASDADGLLTALTRATQEVQARFGIACRIMCEDAIPLADDRMATHLYRIAQEAMNNAIKHAHASRIEIILTRFSGGFVMSIQDDGVGFEAEQRNGDGIGMRIMKHRARMIGATLDVKLAPEGGTIISCHMNPASGM